MGSLQPAAVACSGIATMLSEGERAALRRLEKAIRLMRTAIDPHVPTQVAQAFLAVAMNEGLTLTEYANILGTNISTASRQMLDLGERNRKLEPGYMLVDRKVDPMNLRVNRYTLTGRGRLLLVELVETMGS